MVVRGCGEEGLRAVEAHQVVWLVTQALQVVVEHVVGRREKPVGTGCGRSEGEGEGVDKGISRVRVRV